MEEFIVVNKRILDFKKYKKDFSRFKNIVSVDEKEYFRCLGFTTITMKNKNRFGKNILFYNEELDMEIEVVVRKKHPKSFV